MELLSLDRIKLYRAKVRSRDGQIGFIPIAVTTDAETGKRSISQPALPATPVGVRFARTIVDTVNAAEGKPPSESFEDLDLDLDLDNDVTVDPEIAASTPPSPPPGTEVPKA